MTHHPEQARVLRDVTAALLRGESVSSLIRGLEADAVAPRPRANRWHKSTLQRMLVNPRLAGLAVHQGRIVGTGNWQPIISEGNGSRCCSCSAAAGVAPGTTAGSICCPGLQCAASVGIH